MELQSRDVIGAAVLTAVLLVLLVLIVVAALPK
jgi:hypothetical protein